MTIDKHTGEIIDAEIVEDDLSAGEARELTDRIRQTLTIGHDLIVAAFKGRAWVALGYATWDAYCAGEFAEARMIRLDREQRREFVATAHQAGMSTRAIASGLGVSQFPVRDDLAALRETSRYSPPERVTATDGRSMPVHNRDTTPRPADASATSNARRRSLPDAFWTATYDLEKVTERISRLVADDRFPPNAKTVAARNRSHLLRARDLLTQVIEQLPENEATA